MATNKISKEKKTVGEDSRLKTFISYSLNDKFLLEDFNHIDYQISLNKFKHALQQLRTSDNHNSKVQELQTFFKEEKLVLVLGAGVSMNYGLPSWDVLLQKLMMATLEKDKNTSTVLSKLIFKLFNPTPLIAGRYLQKYFETNNLSFEEAVREILYEQIDRNCQSALMDEIVKFCIAPGKSASLNSIITYNFDDILEECLKKTNLDLPYRSIYGSEIDVTTGELPIYHVHGFLPSVEKLTNNNQITFGESIYHKQYIDTYSWNNIVQINKFREYNCLFIGTSLTDPNTRRLLDISNQQRTSTRGSHFIFKLKYNPENVNKALEILLTQNENLMDEKVRAELKFDTTVETLIQTIESFEENDLLSLGVKTIWIKDYAEIPKILKEIRK